MNKVLRRSTANETAMRRRSMTTVARSYVGRGLGAALAILLGQLSAPQAKAGDYDVGSIHIADTWARATPKGASSGAGYMTVTNNGTAPDRLSCVSSDTSVKCQIHSMTMENSIMKMRPAEGGLEIKPGETVMLKPAGVHLMFLDLKHSLEQGDRRGEAAIREGRHESGGASYRRHRGARPGRRRGRRYDDAGRRHDADEAPQMGACGLCVTI